MGKLAELCDEIGWSLRHFADRAGINERTARRWDADDITPRRMTDWLSAIVQLIRAVPPPETKLGRRPAVTADKGLKSDQE